MTGYHLHASDGDIGRISGFLVDDQTWAIRYLVVDTSTWLLGRKVLVAPSWVTGVHWADKPVSTELSRASIKGAPPYDSTAEWNRDQELKLYRHYGRSGYWAEGPLVETST